jgi:hypothetical protein
MKTYLLLLRVVLFVSFVLTLIVTGIFYLQNWQISPLVPTVLVILVGLIVADAYNIRAARKVNQ